MDKLSLGDLVNFKRGYDLPNRDREEGPIPIVSSSGITGTHKYSMAKGPGVVTGRYGTLGEVFFLKSDYWPLNTSLYVQDFKGNDPKFIFYYLKTVLNENFNSAGAVPGVNRNYLHKIKVPPIPKEQKKIAAILSAYDDLIENNKSRIAILENIAEEIYREWFVRFRFPGYQTAEFEKGIPKSWEGVHIEKMLMRIPVGKRYEQKTVYEQGKVPVLDQGQSGIIGFHDDEPGVIASIDDPVIVFANHTCYQRLIFYPFSAIQNVLPFKSSVEYPSSVIWLHYATHNVISFNEYKGHWPEFISKQILYPGENLTIRFEEVVKYILAEIANLDDMVKNLQETRNQLLPRLISGKLSVKDLDIQFPPSMQEDSAA
jgi:type I restriction enzyme S subunit